MVLNYCSVFLLLLFCSPAQSTFQSEMENLYENLFKEDEPGGSILVMKGEEIKFMQSYGLADLETKEEISENTIFNTGSISKTFVVNGILMLQERGRLTVKDDLNKHFDDFDNRQIAGKIRLEHLLSHSSGLPDSRRVNANPNFFLTANDQENFEPLKRTQNLNFEPGEQFQYSNPAFNGLALIIENSSGQKWQAFIKENIFHPSGMVDSRITDGAHPASGVAHAYARDGNKFKENDYGEYPTFTAAGNGGVWCSVLDLAKYEKALNEHIFISKESLENSRTPMAFENWASETNPHLGYGWFVGEQSLFGENSGLGEKMVYHTGSQGGFRAFYITIPGRDILYVALFNRPFDQYRTVMMEGVNLIKKYHWFD